MKLISKHQAGQSLVEVIIALAVVVALAISLVTASLVTQRTSRSATNSTQATKLVQENIEQIRALRDRRGFSYLASFVGNSCLVLDSSSGSDPKNWSLTASSCPRSVLANQVTFSRSLTVTNGSNSKQKVVMVTVTWVDSGGTQTVSNSTVLSDCVSTTTAC